MPDFVIPSSIRVTVKNDQMRFLSADVPGIFGSLPYAFGYRGIQTVEQNFQFDHDALHFAVKIFYFVYRPFHNQIRAFTTQGIFAINASATVNDALQKSQQQQMRAGFLIASRLLVLPV